MKKQKILISALAALMFSSANVSAQDVYVDLSVLDSLGTDASVAPAPLFPVVSPEPQKVKKVVKKATASKKTKIKKAAKAEKNTEEAAKNKVSIPEKSEIKIENLKPVKDNMPDLSSEQAQIKDQPVNKAAAAAVMEQAEKERISAKNDELEENGSLPEKDLSADNEEKAENVSASTGTELISMAPVEMPEPPADKMSETVAPAEPRAVSDIRPLVPVKPSANAAQPEIAPIVEPAAPVSADNAAVVSNNILFADGVSELTEAQKTQIDTVISRFEDPKNNKIAIFSYNYDDGEDVFRKKRTSLNRAVEIRSYLLGKGYKNFSIKVINVDEASKDNLVMVDELK